MQLFEHNSSENLLPYDGQLNYIDQIFINQDADLWLHKLMQNIDWKNDELVMFGKKIITSRKVAWYANKAFSYTYSNKTKQALIWTPALLELQKIVEEASNQTFNSCLLNLYHHGKESMGWHSDNESELEANGTIASLSLGAERKFMFRHKASKKVIHLLLANGSLLLMKDTIQKHWQHQLPPMAKVSAPRINLTFRNIKP